MCSHTAALRKDLMILCRRQDSLVLDKLNQTVESIDVAVLQSTGLPGTYAENKNKCSRPRVSADNQGHSLVWSTHSTPIH